MTDSLLAAIALSLAALGIALAMLARGSGSARLDVRRTMGVGAALGGVALLLLALTESS